MKTKKSKRSPQMNFEVNQDFINALTEVLDRIQIPKAQFIREAVWQKIADTKNSHPAFQSLNSAEMPNQ